MTVIDVFEQAKQLSEEERQELVKLLMETIYLPAYQPTLDELLSGITPENIHAEISTGQPQGEEAW